MKDVIDELLANPILHSAGSALLLAATALWLAAAWWAYQDATRRVESPLAGFAAATWVILSTPLLLPLSLGIYALARPQRSASDSRTEQLMAQLNQIAADRPTCPGCEASVDPEWLRCPHCATWFAVECESCGEWSAAALELCPFCGTDRAALPVGVAATGVAATNAAGARAAGHGPAAASKPAAAGGAVKAPRPKAPRLQRGRTASSWRPASYEASRASSSVSS